MNTKQLLCYYDTERYLFEEVSARFLAQGYLDAFDFFTIVVWKANRAKSRIAARLMRGAQAEETLDSVCRRLTADLFRLPGRKERFDLLCQQKPWGFLLPMASALLTVLYPAEFTVYDYRARERLRLPRDLATISNLNTLWQEYEVFIGRVRGTSEGNMSLRDCDRLLMARSVSEQLARDIATWSARGSGA